MSTKQSGRYRRWSRTGVLEKESFEPEMSEGMMNVRECADC